MNNQVITHVQENACLNDDVIKKVNETIQNFKNERKDETKPQAGDIVICYGFSRFKQSPVTYNYGHLERVKNGVAEICTQPSTPFMSNTGRLQTSGGYWFSDDITKFKLVGRKRKNFWTWAEQAKAHGGVYFQTDVNVWELTNNEKIY